MKYDHVIIGAGIYGLYAAQCCAKNNKTVLILECENTPFTRASYINQARLHMGYHYPRSDSTATKTAQYFDRFVNDYKECINDRFDQIYAISSTHSRTDKTAFENFCKNTDISLKPADPDQYFNPETCTAAYLTKECAFDAQLLKTQMLNELNSYKNITIKYNTKIHSINQKNGSLVIIHRDRSGHGDASPVLQETTANSILNATYASINQIQKKAGFETFEIKYELCELILCKVSENLKNTGITIMDGPFFSIMPFGNTGYHTLSSVEYSPHLTSYDELPTFECQAKSAGYCTRENLGNCNTCPVKPETARHQIKALTEKYLKPEIKIEYIDSLYSIKPILKASEIDDSRPTIIKTHTKNPTFISVLSGKINTIYDLDDVLKE